MVASETIRIGEGGPGVSWAAAAYAASVGIIDKPELSSINHSSSRAAFETFPASELTVLARWRDWFAGLKFHRRKYWLRGDARSTYLLKKLESNLDSRKLHRAGRIAELFAIGAWWCGNNDVAAALWHRSAAIMTGHGAAMAFARPDVQAAVIASLAKRRIVTNSDIAAKLPDELQMGKSWPHFTYQFFTHRIYDGNMTGTYAYETPFLFKPIVLRFFPKIRTIHSPDVKVHFRISNDYADRERVQLYTWANAGIPTVRIIADGDAWYARERIVGPSKAHLRAGSFYGLSRAAVDEANASWSRIPDTLVKSGFMSHEQAHLFAEHNTAYNVTNGTWTVLRPARIM